MGRMFVCPMATAWGDGEQKHCIRDACAWWHGAEERCAVMTLAGFAAVTMGYLGGEFKSIMCVKKPKKGKEGGDNGK